MKSALTDSSWAQFNESQWNVQGKTLSFGDPDGSGMYLEAHVYVNDQGKIRTPPRVPYLQINFRPTASRSRQKRERQWLEASAEIAERMHKMGFAGAVALCPEVTDVRAWQHLGYRAEVRYTYILQLPYDLTNATNAVRKNIKKSIRSGYQCELSQDYEAVLSCLKATEDRQDFTYGLNQEDLRRLHSMVGPECCRMYLCRSGTGEAVSSRIVLHTPGGRAIDWVAGTKAEHLQQGVTQQLIDYTLRDLAEAGASEFDYGGANIPNVARSKMEWGGTLTPFFTIRPASLKTLAQDGQRWFFSTFRRLSRGDR